MTKLEILNLFCGGADDGPQFSRPWFWQGDCYATDSTCAIRITGDVPGVEVPKGKVPVLDRAFASDIPRPFSVDLTTLPTPEPGPCHLCRGTKKDECRTCYGAGRHSCLCGDEHECGRCDGLGEVPCDCDGGKVWDTDPIECGAAGEARVLIAPRILAKLKALPGAMVMRCANSSDVPVVVEFDGGVAVAMRMRK